jgi:hypothetical protein
MPEAAQAGGTSGNPTAMGPNIIRPHYVVDLDRMTDGAKKAVDDAGDAAVKVTKGSAYLAFRHLEQEAESGLPRPVLNRIGNLSGMVKSKTARVVYNFAFPIAEVYEKANPYLIGAAIGRKLYTDRTAMDHIWNGDLPAEQKVRLITPYLVSAVASETIGSLFDLDHSIAKTIANASSQVARATGSKAAGQLASTMNSAAANIWVWRDKLSSPQLMQGPVNETFDFITVHVLK